jgi:hypothetical protein
VGCEEEAMNTFWRKTLLWTPRVLGILFVLFLGIFALDIFDMQLGFWGTIVGLFMHLIPNILLGIVIALAWKWEWVGAVGFLGWAIFYVERALGFDWVTYAIIAGIPALIGLLYLVGWIWRKRIRGSPSLSPKMAIRSGLTLYRGCATIIQTIARGEIYALQKICAGDCDHGSVDFVLHDVISWSRRRHSHPHQTIHQTTGD